MTRTALLASVAVAVNALELGLFFQAPHLESNPIMAAMPVAGVAALKVLVIVTALLIARALRRRPAFRVGALIILLAAGAIGAGSEARVLASPSRSASAISAPAPSPAAMPALSLGSDVFIPTRRVPIQAPDRAASIPVEASLRGSIAEPIIGGRATWYGASGMIGAAGPDLRDYIGAGWRGALVSVCHGRCIVVKLADWCACHGGGYRRLIDLSDDAFAQLAPLSKGVIAVSITRVVHVPEPPATDTEGAPR